MSLIIRHPAGRSAEREYIFDVICRERLGLDCITSTEDRDDVCLSIAGSDSELRIPDLFFRTPREKWLRPESLPTAPLEYGELPKDVLPTMRVDIDPIPLLFGEAVGNRPAVIVNEQRIDLNVDIFGSAFFLLTRYEEACFDVRDQYGRFPASHSLVADWGLVDRPVVDEYVEILRACLNRLGSLPKHDAADYRVVLSHDVDRMFDTRGASMPALLRNAAGDLLKRKDVHLAVKRLYAGLLSEPDDYSRDPCNTFEFIMDCSERHGLRSAFNFIATDDAGGMNGDYSVALACVRALIRKLSERGHEIGLHGSFESFEKTDQLALELSRLKSIARDEGVMQGSWGGRQHYLRWAVPTTWQVWNDAGLAYDSTLTFPEAPGFRCGTCFEYPVFNLRSRQKLALRERPLIVMETSLFGDRYLGLSNKAALDRIVRLSQVCRRFGGQFTMLWHNDKLVTRRQKHHYRDVLAAIA